MSRNEAAAAEAWGGKTVKNETNETNETNDPNDPSFGSHPEGDKYLWDGSGTPDPDVAHFERWVGHLGCGAAARPGSAHQTPTLPPRTGFRVGLVTGALAATAIAWIASRGEHRSAVPASVHRQHEVAAPRASESLPRVSGSAPPAAPESAAPESAAPESAAPRRHPSRQRPSWRRPRRCHASASLDAARHSATTPRPEYQHPKLPLMPCEVRSQRTAGRLRGVSGITLTPPPEQWWSLRFRSAAMVPSSTRASFDTTSPTPPKGERWECALRRSSVNGGSPPRPNGSIRH